jgi:hypothetical protein
MLHGPSCRVCTARANENVWSANAGGCGATRRSNISERSAITNYAAFQSYGENAGELMLFYVDVKSKQAEPVPVASMSDMRLSERYDFQEWLLRTPTLLGEELLIVASEFAGFDRTSERIDVLAVDRAGKLVIVELKRSAIGTRADLQALRYAAYCSTFTLGDVAELFSSYVSARERRLMTSEEAAHEIRGFVQAPDFEGFDDKPRIILAAEEFPPEMTATLLWLRTFEVEISAVRLRPYSFDGRLLVDSQVLIPLPEAEDFIIRKEKKEVDRADGKGDLYRAWFQGLIDELRERHNFTNARLAQGQNWYNFSSGVSGIHYAAAFSKGGLRAEVYIDVGEASENKRIFDELRTKSELLDKALQEHLVWERLDNRRASRISLVHGIHITASPQELEQARVWATEALMKLKEAFGPDVMALARNR